MGKVQITGATAPSAFLVLVGLGGAVSEVLEEQGQGEAGEG